MMDKLSLIKPSLDYEEQILNYRKAFANEHLYGGNHLEQLATVSEWLNHLERAASPETVTPGRAPSSTFLCIRERDNQMVGICNIRHNLNQDYLINIAGHIGYSVLPSERRQGYAIEQLRLALEKARVLGIQKVLVTAADWNVASQKTILANGGIYEDTRLDESDGDHMLRYWIELD
ncbi:GNAT family N-acetyltransferase [Streptococcus caprae]|uniref:GNAT family N-acetyltransferase n=1 Tax=Streptococcus caprae TaxID=1640501 RepID=A0ABV8CUG4_9STRE